MNDLIRPGEGLLFMKIGSHAQEGLAAIIARKSEEIRQTGFGMWGYGGGTCHPTSMVQPFAESFAERGQTIHLVMEEMSSNHRADPLSAAEFSADGLAWEAIPPTIDVRGSRYALVIERLREARFSLPLDQTRVPLGPSTGRLGSRYLRGRVDKACLEVTEAPEVPNEGEPRIVPINLVADLRAPFAVFLRGERK
ncbi:MAG TPA: hypothetical protein VGG29_07050 [Caulobacteraceae bacterium]